MKSQSECADANSHSFIVLSVVLIPYMYASRLFRWMNEWRVVGRGPGGRGPVRIVEARLGMRDGRPRPLLAECPRCRPTEQVRVESPISSAVSEGFAVLDKSVRVSGEPENGRRIAGAQQAAPSAVSAAPVLLSARAPGADAPWTRRHPH